MVVKLTMEFDSINKRNGRVLHVFDLIRLYRVRPMLVILLKIITRVINILFVTIVLRILYGQILGWL